MEISIFAIFDTEFRRFFEMRQFLFDHLEERWPEIISLNKVITNILVSYKNEVR